MLELVFEMLELISEILNWMTEMLNLFLNAKYQASNNWFLRNYASNFHFNF